MRFATLFAALLGAAATVRGALVINVGTHELLPDTPNQSVLIEVSGGDLVEGFNLNAQVADGGIAAGGSILGPTITDADVLLGTIFSANNLGQDNPGSFPQLATRTVVTATGTVPANGLVATLTIDTTGFSAGAWELKLSDTRNGDSDFIDVPVTITNGSLSVVPEPSMVALAVGVGLLGCLTRRCSQSSLGRGKRNACTGVSTSVPLGALPVV